MSLRDIRVYIVTDITYVSVCVVGREGRASLVFFHIPSARTQ